MPGARPLPALLPPAAEGGAGVRRRDGAVTLRRETRRRRCDFPSRLRVLAEADFGTGFRRERATASIKSQITDHELEMPRSA
jgi:hypothetical protein